MFKRFRNNRITSEPPAAPTADEILADLETFQLQSQMNLPKKNHSHDDSMDQWWQEFELFAEGHKNLKILEQEICNNKDKLETYKKYLEGETTKMKKEINLKKTQMDDFSNRK